MKANNVSACICAISSNSILHKLAFMSILASIMLALTSVSCFAVNKAPSKDLVIYNWEDYMPEVVLQEFEALTGYKVRQLYYESEQDARELILESGGAGIDLVVLSRYELSVLASQTDAFAPIPYQTLRNTKHIDPIWKKKSANVYNIAVPWLWGTNGVLYRKDLVEVDHISWMDLMSPPPSSKGKVMMIPAMRDIMSAALFALNESINTSDEEVLLKVGELLQAQRKNVAGYDYLTTQIVSGEVHMSQSYSSDAVEFLSLNENIVYVLPDNRTNIWLNSLAVFEASEHKDIAFRFIDFVNEPKRAAYIAEYLWSATTNKSATAYFSDDYLEDTSLNIPPSLLESAEMLESLSPEVTSKYNAVFFNAVRPEF